MTNSLIKAGTKLGVLGQEFYTQEELQYFLDNYDTFTEDMISHKYSLDMTTLSLISSNDTYTTLMYNGEEITLPSSLINDLISSNSNTYSSEKIEEKLLELKNTIGVGDGTSSATVTQKTFLNVISNDTLNINTIDNFNLQNAIIQPYKFVPGVQNITEIIKRFDNTDATNFYYNINTIEFNGAMKIKDKYDVGYTYDSVNGYYESGVINKSDYLGLYWIDVG